jgi:polyphosphate kinase
MSVADNPTAPVAAPVPSPRPIALDHPGLYINRELSWLEFNERVLAQAQDASHPLLERVKFLAIVASNLDEFFMIRVAALLRKYRNDIDSTSPDGRGTEEQLRALRDRAEQMMRDQAACWLTMLRPALEQEGICFLEMRDYTREISRFLTDYFRTTIFPVLTPLAFDPGPFPFISNLSKNLAVEVRHAGITRFARVKIPDTLPRFVPLPEGAAGRPGLVFAFLEDVIKANIDALFPGCQVEGTHVFRIVRDTDIVIQEDEAADLLESVDQGLKQLRYGALSLLLVEDAMPRHVADVLVENFEVEREVVHRAADRVGYDDWVALTTLHRPQLKDPPLVPRVPWTVGEDPNALFDRLKAGDQLVHHPYDSFSTVEGFLHASVHDPHVIAIKMTLYRIGDDSPLIDLLIEAAERGKQVAVLVELKARFDERTNINWANRLESAGIHVVHGIANLKTHCKLCLVVRKEGDAVRCYAHVATGNYNRATAQVYTDFGLFTARRPVTDDVVELFNQLTGYSAKRVYRKLIVAPHGLRAGLERLVDREAAHARAGRPARIVIKANAVTDPDAIRVLYRASRAGVRIDMIVRGICCLRPGLAGTSETIRVRSIVGRFLEHGRVYVFENGGEPDVYIGSADLMERNLDRRVEVLCRIDDPEIRARLRSVVELELSDTVRAWELSADGSYHRAVQAPGAASVNAQERLLRVG